MRGTPRSSGSGREHAGRHWLTGWPAFGLWALTGVLQGAAFGLYVAGGIWLVASFLPLLLGLSAARIRPEGLGWPFGLTLGLGASRVVVTGSAGSGVLVLLFAGILTFFAFAHARDSKETGR